MRCGMSTQNGKLDNMSDSQPIDISHLPARPLKSRVRLSLSHLFLWVATTGLMLVPLQSCKPPTSPDRIGIGGMQQLGVDTQATRKLERQRFWQRWRLQFWITLAAAPFYGAAMAGLVLATWRLAMQRFGFTLPLRQGRIRT